jgi:GNAT superfamily N-acetyltransferase
MSTFTKIYYKTFPKKYSDRLPDLFSGTPDLLFFGTENKQVIVAIFDERKDWDTGKTKKFFIGAANITFEDFTLKKGKPKYNIYIDRFEICKKYRNQGYGKHLFYRIRTLFDINEISLVHRTYDSGVSKKFWMEQGFKHDCGLGSQHLKYIEK